MNQISNASLEIITEVPYGSSKTISDCPFFRTLKGFPFITKVCDMSSAVESKMLVCHLQQLFHNELLFFTVLGGGCHLHGCRCHWGLREEHRLKSRGAIDQQYR